MSEISNFPLFFRYGMGRPLSFCDRQEEQDEWGNELLLATAHLIPEKPLAFRF